MKFFAVIFCVCLILVSGKRYWHRSRNAGPMARPEWDKLSVTWLKWETMPLNVSDAVANGWTLQHKCQESTYFRGDRYVRNGDKTLMLLFGANNEISGIQTGVSRSIVGIKQLPWIEENDSYIITAYFRDPSQICSQKASHAKYIGDRLLILNSTTSAEFVQASLLENGLSKSMWTEGRCLWSMGKLYWYDLSNVSDCNTLFPVFLMYTNEALNGFGWILPHKIDNSQFVHATNTSFPNLFTDETVPECFRATPALSLMHVYLDSNPLLNICQE